MNEKYLQEFFVNQVTNVHILTQQVRYADSLDLIKIARAMRSKAFDQSHVDYLNKKSVRLESIDFSKAILLVATV